MNALDIIRKFEGCHRRVAGGKVAAYADPAHGPKVPTIGWGSTGVDVTMDTVWSQGACDARLAQDAGKFERGVAQLSPPLALEDARRAAMTSFAYNLGLGNYGSSTLRRKVNERAWPEAAAQCRRWVRAGGRVLPGLVLRRELEAALLERG